MAAQLSTKRVRRARAPDAPRPRTFPPGGHSSALCADLVTAHLRAALGFKIFLMSSWAPPCAQSKLSTSVTFRVDRTGYGMTEIPLIIGFLR